MRRIAKPKAEVIAADLLRVIGRAPWCEPCAKFMLPLNDGTQKCRCVSCGAVSNVEYPS